MYRERYVYMYACILCIGVCIGYDSGMINHDTNNISIITNNNMI